MNNNHNHASMLRGMLSEHEAKLMEARLVIRREEPIVTSLKSALTALEQETSTSADITLVSIEHATATPPMPERKADYVGVTHVASAKLALERISSPGKTTHVDNIIKEIYVAIPNADLFYRVKRTLVSELLRGMKKGSFVRGTSPNTFGLPKEQQRMAG